MKENHISQPFERDEGPQWVRCPECGNEQTDMGRGVQCEECGFGPMPSPSSDEQAERSRTLVKLSHAAGNPATEDGQ